MSRAEVVLVAMPFGPLQQPSIGLSLLRAALAPIPTSILYFTIQYADLLGRGFYDWVAQAHSGLLLGEWLFRDALFEGHEPPGDYVKDVLTKPPHPSVPTAARLYEMQRAVDVAAGFADQCAERIVALDPIVVGFTNAFAQQVSSLAVARRIKGAHPDITIVMGGANCEGVMGLELVAQFPFVDAVVSGEAEVVFPELVRRVMHGASYADLQGVYTRGQRQISVNAAGLHDLDALPDPSYAEFFQQWHASETSQSAAATVLFETSRGCWWGETHHCTFCGLNGATMTFRSKSADRVVAEIESLSADYPGAFLMSVDNIIDVRYFRDLFPRLAQRPTQPDLFFAVKANLRREQLAVMRAAGVRHLQPGIESLSDRVLALMRKGETAMHNIQLLKWCEELGIRVNWNLLWGFPGEPPEEYERMASLLPLISHLPPPQTVGSIRQDRFSPNFEHADRLGFANVRPAAAYAHVYPFERDVLHRLAYHFDFDYADGRRVDEYTQRLAAVAAGWRHTYADSHLVWSTEADGAIRIVDLRPAAVETIVFLTDAEASAFRACERVRSIQAVIGEVRALWPLASNDQIARAIDRLIELGVLLRQGDRLLALAVASVAATAANGDEPDATENRPRIVTLRPV